MTEKIIPEYIMHYFKENPKISRNELSRKAGIANQKARFYVQVYRSLNQKNNKVIKRGVALFDIHYPEQDKACMNIVLKFIYDFKPNYIVLGGDQMDLNCISHHNKGKVRLTENARLKRDYRGFQKEILDEIEAAAPKNCKKWFLIGNHEYWLERLIDDNPQLEGLVEIENNLNLKDWTIIPFNNVLTIGEMNFIHGIWTNKYHAEKNIRIYNKNIFSGHIHTNQTFTTVSPINAFPRQGVSIGCLCNTNMHYLYEKPTAWVHQFLFWYEFEDGSFTYYAPIIINGKCVINNKLYTGD